MRLSIIPRDMTDPLLSYRPMSWPRRKKITTLMLYGAIAMGSSFNSSVFSAASGQVAAQFHVSQIVTSLGTSVRFTPLILPFRAIAE